MYADNYKIAGHSICIRSLHEEVQRLCTEYRTSDPAELTVETTQADIVFERERSAREDEFEGIPTREFTDSYFETLAVYRKICANLLDSDILLFHGSVVAVDGEAYLFTAKSGTGKSTHTRLWREYFGSRAVMINDDKPLIRVTESRAVVYGTPWDGKHHLSTNTSAKLKAICILQRGELNRIVPLTVKEAYPMLMQQVNRPNGAAAMTKTFDLIDRLTEKASLWQLSCNISTEAVKIAYNAMKG